MKRRRAGDSADGLREQSQESAVPVQARRRKTHVYVVSHTVEAVVHLCSLGVLTAAGCEIGSVHAVEYPRHVYDAVLFNNEVYILKIRWKELYPYVTEFVLLESNWTFTGLPKPYVFSSVRDEFKFLEARLTYGQVPGRFRKGENPFVEEAYQRLALDYLLKQAGIQ
ncbi:beta-1,4-mannosyl-glycoprotein 4-beta-N-acetylglucosaminyltransferase-like [Dorcoceras hygrometricum]|uniref:Beta-1,4-mannosyl-glycoprotein 4-beta-N-acetylglucosaminyltransferase-like n=1 Tax=Dorcoceras hygrometricum TaxID=472368 RepID=A0A2Z7BNM2_9LAMI|nr:beta-1,4-mannosyl-glycoprotein 4-beta-N-acetylglucosaminyltransferase-like [Dorcoceras hygrometricum]